MMEKSELLIDEFQSNNNMTLKKLVFWFLSQKPL